MLVRHLAGWINDLSIQALMLFAYVVHGLTQGAMTPTVFNIQRLRYYIYTGYMRSIFVKTALWEPEGESLQNLSGSHRFPEQPSWKINWLLTHCTRRFGTYTYVICQWDQCP